MFLYRKIALLNYSFSDMEGQCNYRHILWQRKGTSFGIANVHVVNTSTQAVGLNPPFRPGHGAIINVPTALNVIVDYY